MKIGVSLRSAYPPMDVREGARWMIERARAANDAGLDSLFVGDHHNVPVPYYQNVPMIGRLLAEWDDRPAGALFLLPLWHPVLLAEQIGTLAAIAGGPFVMQCAVGGGDEQFDALGVPIRKRPSLFEATLDIVRRLCAGEQVDTEAPFRIARARIAPIPPQPLEVWIGAAAPAAIDRAARLGDAFLIGPEATPAQVAELADTYREACRAPRPRTRADRGSARRARGAGRPRRRPGGGAHRRCRLPRVRPVGPGHGRTRPGGRGLRGPGRGGLHRRDRAPSRRGPGRSARFVGAPGVRAGSPARVDIGAWRRDGSIRQRGWPASSTSSARRSGTRSTPNSTVNGATGRASRWYRSRGRPGSR